MIKTRESIKPHHLLDIIRDIGAGKVHTPHPYGHDFHRLAEVVRGNPSARFAITSGADSICAPCRNLKDGLCTDTTEAPGYLTSKYDYNLALDKRLFERLQLEENQVVSVLEFCEIVSARLGDIFSLYPEISRSSTELRAGNIERGLRRITTANE